MSAARAPKVAAPAITTVGLMLAFVERILAGARDVLIKEFLLTIELQLQPVLLGGSGQEVRQCHFLKTSSSVSLSMRIPSSHGDQVFRGIDVEGQTGI